MLELRVDANPMTSARSTRWTVHVEDTAREAGRHTAPRTSVHASRARMDRHLAPTLRCRTGRGRTRRRRRSPRHQTRAAISSVRGPRVQAPDRSRAQIPLRGSCGQDLGRENSGGAARSASALSIARRRCDRSGGPADLLVWGNASTTRRRAVGPQSEPDDRVGSSLASFDRAAEEAGDLFGGLLLGEPA